MSSNSGKEVPVIDVVPLIPVSRDLAPAESYTPEFSLKLGLKDLPHSEYVVYIVSQDKLVYRLRLHGDSQEPIEVRIIDESNPATRCDKNWPANLMSGISDDQKVFIPGSAGQIKILVVPIRTPRQQINVSAVLKLRLRELFGSISDSDLRETRTRSDTLGMPKGIASSTYLTTGSKGSESGSLYKGDLVVVPNQSPVIYDIRPVAITPDRIQSITAGEILQSLSEIPVPSAN